MQKFVNERLLINGPDLIDLTDLLYFNRLIFPVFPSQLQKNPDFYFGRNEIEDRLFYEKLIIPKEEVVEKEIVEEIEKECVDSEKIVNELHQVKGNLYDPRTISFFLDVVKDHEKMKNYHIRKMSNVFASQNCKVVSKFRSEYFEKIFSFDVVGISASVFGTNFLIRNSEQKSDNGVLNIIMSQLPVLDNSDINIDALVDFLKDEQTQVKRRRLFSWQNDIENKIESGSLKLEHLPDLIATLIDDYKSHVELSELNYKYGKIEVLLVVVSNILSGLTLLGLPTAVKNLIEFKKRKVELLKSEIEAPGRELAYIAYAHKKLS